MLDAGCGARLSLAAIAVRDPRRHAAFEWKGQPPLFTTLGRPGIPVRTVSRMAAGSRVRASRAVPCCRRARRSSSSVRARCCRTRTWIELARANKGRILVPSGAILGLDALMAAAEGRIHAVTMITRKPVRGLAGGALPGNARHRHFRHHRADTGIPRIPREAAIGFPANLNVAVSISLAGMG